MRIKKMISCLLSVSMLVSLAITSAEAEGTALTTYGISTDLSGNKFIKWDGKQYSDSPSTIANVSIINFGDKLGVFNHPTKDYYKTYSNTVRACLMGRTTINGDNTTSTGYTITSNNGEAIISPDNQILTASKDGVNNYIPIVDTYELKFLDTLDGYEAVDSGVKVNKNATNIGFRGYDEKCTTITVPAGSTLSNKTRVQTDGISKLNTPKTTMTVEFDVLVSGDVDANIYCDSGNELMMINHDATVTYPVFSGDVTKVTWTNTAASYPTEAWHHVAITYDYAGSRIMTYIDGQLLSDNGWYIGSTMSPLNSLRVGVKNGTYVQGGYIAYDNLKLSRGYYTKRGTNVTLTQSDDTVYSIDSNNGVITVAYGTTVDSLLASLNANTDAYKIQVYEDPSKAVSAMLLDEMSVVTLVGPDKVTYTDYSVAVAEPSPMQKISLAINDTYPKGFYFTKQNGTVEKTIPTGVYNYYVEKATLDGAEALAVYSNSNQTEYTAYGWRVLETLISTNEYELSIWDSTKEINRSTKDNYDGEKFYGRSKSDEVKAGDWLKAEKNGEVIWIPIISKTDEVIKTTLVDNGGGASAGDASSWGLTSIAKGVGIKEASDSSLQIPASKTSGNIQIGANQSKAIIPEYTPYTGTQTEGVYTWAMNIYPATGASFEYVAVYNSGGAQNIFFKYKDGQITINNPSGTTVTMDFDANRWHRVAISTDPNRHVIQMWVDGQNLLSVGTVYQAILYATRFNINSDNAGDVYFDDIVLNKGYYDVDGDFTVDYADDVMAISATSIKYRSQSITLDDIINATSATNILFYTDSFTTPTNNVAEAKTAILYSENGLAYQYVEIEKSEDVITFKVSSDKTSITATSMYKAPADEVALLVEYVDGRFVSLKLTEVDEQTSVYAFTTYNEGSTYKLIKLSNVNTLAPADISAEYIGE